MARSLDYKRLMQLLCLEMSEEGFSSSRRAFLTKTTTGVLATAALAGCSSFDSWVVGDSHHLNHEVMVVGGGLAGLAAAYQLKKSKTPYRLYEASNRLGGRIQTLTHFNSDNQFAEMGGEFFEASHKTLHQLCKDLGLNAQDVSYDPKSDRAVYWVHGKVMNEKEFRKSLKPIAMKLAQTRLELFASIPTELTPKALLTFSRVFPFDQQSLADLLSPLVSTMDSTVMTCFLNLCASEWGVEVKDINLLQFLVRLDFEERAIAAGPSKIYRIEGGTSRITETLGERVQGVVPDASLKLEHQLVAIRPKSSGYECTFKTPKGSDIVWARQIICTLPWSLLKDVDGIQGIEFSAATKELISKAAYATHSKVACSFKEPFWKKKTKTLPAFQGIFRGELYGQNYWEASRQQHGSHAILTSQRGGTIGFTTGASAIEETLKDLRNFNKEAMSEENSQITNWSQKPFSKGSRYNIGPGNYLKFLEFLTDENDKLNFYFAGEHMSFRDFGTMNGALESAITVADRAMQKAFLKSTFGT